MRVLARANNETFHYFEDFCHNRQLPKSQAICAWKGWELRLDKTASLNVQLLVAGVNVARLTWPGKRRSSVAIPHPARVLLVQALHWIFSLSDHNVFRGLQMSLSLWRLPREHALPTQCSVGSIQRPDVHLRADALFRRRPSNKSRVRQHMQIGPAASCFAKPQIQQRGHRV